MAADSDDDDLWRCSRRAQRSSLATTPLELLTRREREVALLVAWDGLTAAQAAKHLHLSKKTIEYHMDGIYKRLGVANRIQMTRVLAHCMIHDHCIVCGAYLAGSWTVHEPDCSLKHGESQCPEPLVRFFKAKRRNSPRPELLKPPERQGDQR